MDILIKGMEMPTDTLVLVKTDGTAIVYEDEAYVTTATTVPPHGDLIERDRVHELVNWTSFKPPFSKKQVRRFIDDAPTIIEAEVDDG